MKDILIIEYYNSDNLISIEMSIYTDKKMEEYKDFNIYNETLEQMKANAYTYLIEKLKAGYQIVDIQKLIIKSAN